MGLELTHRDVGWTYRGALGEVGCPYRGCVGCHGVTLSVLIGAVCCNGVL